MPEPRIKTTIEFAPDDYDRLRQYADKQDVGLATAIMGLMDGKRPRIAFTPPSVDDVAGYISAKGYPLDAETFVAHYTANGWVQASGRPIKDWKAAVVTWSKRPRQAVPVAQTPHPVSTSKEQAESDRWAEAQQQVARELAEERAARKAAGKDL